MIRFRDFVNAIDSKSIRFIIINDPSKSYVVYEKVSSARSSEYMKRYIDRFAVSYAEDGNTIWADIEVRLTVEKQL